MMNGWHIKTLSLLVCSLAAALVAANTVGADIIKTSPSFTIPDVPAPYFFELGDLNGDKRPDMVISDLVGNKVHILYQRDGKFSLPADKTFEVFIPQGLRIVDFDGDSRNDLLVVGRKDQKLLLLPGKDGFDVVYADNNINQYFGLPAVGRLDKSGSMDFMVGPVWRKWLGNDKFKAGYIKGPEKNNNGEVILADLNLDGSDDMVFSVTDTGCIRLYYGPFMNQSVSPVDASEFIQLKAPFPVTCLTVADLNGDGRPDIAACAYDSNTRKSSLHIYFQNVPVGFSDGAEPSQIMEGVPPSRGIAAADFNGDKLNDLLVANHIFLQAKGKGFSQDFNKADQILLDVNGREFAPNQVKVADINVDGLPDIALSRVVKGGVAVYLNQRN